MNAQFFHSSKLKVKSTQPMLLVTYQTINLKKTHHRVTHTLTWETHAMFGRHELDLKMS